MREVAIDIQRADDGRFNVVETVREVVVKETRNIAGVFIEELHAEWFRTKLMEQAARASAAQSPDTVANRSRVEMPDAAWAALSEDYRYADPKEFDASWYRLVAQAEEEGWTLLPKDVVRYFFFSDLKLEQQGGENPDAPEPAPAEAKPVPPAPPVEEPEPIAALGETKLAAAEERTEAALLDHAFRLIASGTTVTEAAAEVGMEMTVLRAKWACGKKAFLAGREDRRPRQVEEPIVDEIEPAPEPDDGKPVSGGLAAVMGRTKRRWTEDEDRKLETYEMEVGIAVAANRLSRDVEDCRRRLKDLNARREREVAREMSA